MLVASTSVANTRHFDLTCRDNSGIRKSIFDTNLFRTSAKAMCPKAKRELISVRRPEGFTGIELRTGTAVTEPYPRHWHEEYQFCFIREGGGELFYRGVRHNTPRTCLFIVHPGEVHSNQTSMGCSFNSIYIDPEVIRNIFSQITDGTETLPFFQDSMIFNIETTNQYQMLYRSLETPAAKLERESLLLQTLTQLLLRHSKDRVAINSPKSNPAAVKRVREYIFEYYSSNISLETMSRLAGLSPFHLTRVFSREAGMPPHAFQTQVRIAHAKKLIRSGTPLSAVAAATGFSDQSHLIRHFKRLTKITPGEYLRSSKNVQYVSKAER